METTQQDAIHFKRLLCYEWENYRPLLFEILHDNMSKIQPTGNTYKQDCGIWSDAMVKEMEDPCRILVIMEAEGELAGYFQYSIQGGTVFYMEDIQIKLQYQGTHRLFRSLYGFVVPLLPPGIETVKALAGKKNIKSQAILHHLGLVITGERPNSLVYTGHYRDFLHWLYPEHLLYGPYSIRR